MPEVLKFPAPDPEPARQALQNALDESVPLTNVLILSQREDGSIYWRSSDNLTLADTNWILDSFKNNLFRKAGE